MDENLHNNVEDILLETYNNLKHQNISTAHVSTDIQQTSVSSTPLISSIPPSTLGKHGREKPQKYSI